MAEAPIPPRTEPMYIDKAGSLRLSREWILWFQSIATNITGNDEDYSAEFDDIDRRFGAVSEPFGLSDIKARMGSVGLAQALLPRSTAALEARIADLEKRLASVIDGRRADGRRTNFTPAFTSLTEVSTVTKTGYIQQVGEFMLLSATITPSGGGTSASTAGTTYLTIPTPVLGGFGAVNNETSLIAAGLVSVANNRLYLPTWAASADVRTITALLRRT